MAYGRYGPDEFLVIAPADAVAELRPILDRMQARLADLAMQFDASERLPLTVSAGICTYPEHADSSIGLFDGRCRHVARGQGQRRRRDPVRRA